MLEKPLLLLAIEHSLTPQVAGEIEFYLLGADEVGVESWQGEIEAACAAAGIGLHRVEKERGDEQYEISLLPTDAASAAANIIAIRHIITQAGRKCGLEANFATRPKEGQPCSGLHLHIHLADSSGKNVYFKRDEEISPLLNHSIGGLLAWLPASMPVFAPQAEDYVRFTKTGHTPTTISWGANNRTVAIRLPDKAADNKHIEHRVCASAAAPEAAIALMLAAIHDGLSNKIEPSSPQTYGDASLEMYHLAPLPASLPEAQKAMEAFAPLSRYFSVSDLLKDY